MAKKIALVTGASVGIGEAFARRLAGQGHDLILVARDRGRLEALAASMRQRHGVEVEVLVADLTDEGALASVEERARDVELSMLINNAGYGTVGRFAQMPLAGELGQVRLNVMAPVRLTHAALPGMVARGRGSILNVSSMVALQPSPFTATYAATKAFLNMFTESLAFELRGTGVRVQALCPGFTRTEFQQRAQVDMSRLPSFLWMTADQVVDASFDALDAGRLVCVPGLANRALAAAVAVVPRAFSGWTSGELFRIVAGL